MPGEYESVDDIAAEIAAVYPGFKGLGDKARTGGEGFLWREGAAKAASPAYLVDPAVSVPQAPDKGNLTVVTGALLNHSGTVTRHCPGLNEVVDEVILRIAPADAEAMNLADGDSAIVHASGGAVTAKVKVDETMAPGALFLPIHFENVRVQTIVSPAGKDGEKSPAKVTVEKVKTTVGAST
jgi:predicted molibdopterin-dependent oxidoreductase YjgC